MARLELWRFSLALILVSGCSLIFSGSEEEPSGNVDTVDREACSTLAPLRNDFSGAELSPKWRLTTRDGYEDAYTQGDEQRPGAHFSFEVDAETAGVVTAALTSRFDHDLRDQALTVQVGAIPEHITVSMSVFLDLGGKVINPNARIEHRMDTGNLYFILGNQDRANLPYDSDRDVYWQIREGSEDGFQQMYFETGPTLDAMTTRFENQNLGDFDPSHVAVSLGVATLSSGEVSFLNVNWDQPATTYCLTGDFKDSFEQPTLDQKWSRSLDDYCTFTPLGNTLEVLVDGIRKSCKLETYQALNLRHSEAELRFDPPLDLSDDTTLSLSLLTRDQDSLRLHVDGAGVAQAMMTLGGDPETVPSGSVDILFPITAMRIRHEQVTEEIVWELQGGDGEIKILHHQVVPLELDGLNLRINVYGGNLGGSVIIGGVNAE